MFAWVLMLMVVNRCTNWHLLILTAELTLFATLTNAYRRPTAVWPLAGQIFGLATNQTVPKANVGSYALFESDCNTHLYPARNIWYSFESFQKKRDVHLQNTTGEYVHIVEDS
jgi:hypothetical protein